MKNHVIREHSAGDENCWLLKAEGAWDKNYWLYFTVPKDAALSCVDKFLRQIWLECCGHLSAFRQGRRGVGKNRRLSGFAPGDTLTHEYDFGSTTETLLTFVEEITRPAQKEKVRLLARNAPPEYPCGKCGKAAAWVNCREDGDLLCEACAADYEEGLLPLVNSPRRGECGYDGEQDRWAFEGSGDRIQESGVVKQDDGAPTMEQWAALHEVAQGIKAIAPWEFLWEDNFVTLNLPGTDELVYCSAMGAAGECFGIGIYPGNEALARMRYMARAAETAPPFAYMFEQKCLNCFFGDREELEKEERDILKELGIKYRGHNQWVYFRSSKPGCPPLPINREEAALLIEALQNMFMALKGYLEKKVELDFEKGETLYRFYDEEKKLWLTTGAKMPESLPFGMDTLCVDNEEFLAEMNAAKKTKQVLELDLVYLPMPVQEQRDGPIRMPRCFFACDAKTGRMLGQSMMEWDDEPEDALLDFLEDWIKAHGRPAKLLARNVFVGMHLMDFCRKTDIALEMEGTPMLDKALNSLMEFMGMQDDL